MVAHPNGGTGLSWWKVCTSWASFPTACASSRTQPFPPIGPDVTGGPTSTDPGHPYANIDGHAYDIPAALAYRYLPIDTSYQGSFAVTGSSWSGGIETLTASGLPGGEHLMGGFELTGANSACNPSAGELFMTGSSSTTISYALASNPGTSCTGTVKWPDVREFDERVYQSDASGTPSPAVLWTPSSFTFPDVAVSGTGTSVFTLQNTGNAALNVSLSVTAGVIWSIQSTTCDSTLAASATCSVTVGFAPVGAWAFWGTLTETDTENGVTGSASLAGSGVTGPPMPSAPTNLSATVR